MREQQNNRQERTIIGLDLGDRWHRFCVLGESGQVVKEGSVANNRVALSELSSRYPGALVVMEAGCHSPWVSRHLEQAGCEVIVSNPRKTRAIYQHERKSDRRDALMLARIARMEPALLYPVRHGSEEAQQDLLRERSGRGAPFPAVYLADLWRPWVRAVEPQLPAGDCDGRR